MIQEIDNFIGQELCRKIIKLGKFPHLSNSKDKQYYYLEFINRSHTASDIHKLIDAYDEQTNKISPFFPYRWIMLMRYPEGQGTIYRHKDTYNSDAEYEANTYSMLLYLNDVEEGGETVIFDGKNELIIKPKAGKLLIMSGDIEHEARKPIGQDKYVVLSRHN